MVLNGKTIGGWMAGFGVAGVLLAGTVARGQVLVTEFLPNPSGTDIDREWFEIYNPGSSAFDLSGYAAGDGTGPTSTSTGEAMGVFPAGSLIDPGEVWVIAADAEGFADFYGFKPTFEFANSTSTNFPGNDVDVPDLVQKSGWGVANASLGIANTSDDVGILTPDSTAGNFTFIDGGNHGTLTTFYTGAVQLAGDQSYERVPAFQDTDSINDWIIRASGAATPGTIEVPEPASLSLLAAGALLLGRRRRGPAQVRGAD